MFLLSEVTIFFKGKNMRKVKIAIAKSNKIKN